jgi:pilus assembly protein CpaF
MTNVLQAIVESVRNDLTASRSPSDVRAAATRHIRGLIESSPELAALDEQSLVASALDELSGFGALQPFLDDTSIEEIWINAPDAVFIARAGIAERTGVIFEPHQIRHLVERMLASTGRRVDSSSPFVDASLPDGSRLHVVIPDITAAHWSVNIRKFSRSVKSLDDLVERKSLTRKLANLLVAEMSLGTNILVSGATQAGKTTMLNALLHSVAPRERIITVEETFELNCQGADVVALQCRQPNLEGSGEVTLRRLIKEALRMRPDRLVVGEVREAESLDLLIALNSGLPGACTIHGNSARDALAKLCTLPLLAGRNIDSAFIVPAVASSIGLVVHCELNARGERRVREVVRVTGRITGGLPECEVIFS